MVNSTRTIGQVVIETSRLCLRLWTEQDLPVFAAMNADARVMEFMPHALSPAESDAVATRIREHFERHGFGLWAVEVKGGASFAGFVGLNVSSFQAHFTPCVEAGWRLAYEHRGHGYAIEAARAAVDFGFRSLGLGQI